jgi:RNA polymerase sigma-70 factor (ECF subfamily)
LAASSQSSVQPDPLFDETALIIAAQRGQSAAFDRLVSAYQDLAYNVARRLVGDPESAADATQEAFLAAFRHLNQFKGGSFKSWLLRIVTNCCYDALRARRRREATSLDVLVDDAGFDLPDATNPLPEVSALSAELFRCVEEGLKTLPIDQRAVLLLYDVHGLSYDEVASVLNASLGTVKSRLSRARGRLRDYLMRHRELWQG